MKKCLLFFLGLSIPIFSLFGQEIIESSSLPIVMIDTRGEIIPDEPKIVAHMGIIANEDGNRNLLSDPFTEYDGRISIEIRGSSSQLFPKKSYGFETQKEDGENRNISLLGMPRENDWILHGPFSDKSLVRNRLAFELGAKLSGYAPKTRLVELIINEDYRGVYILMEKIKRDKNRVSIAKLSATDTDPDTISGGYIIKLDKFTGSGGDGFTSDEGSVFQYEYPDTEDINFEQAAYIKNYIKEFERTLFGFNFKDPESGYQKYIDVPSFIDFIIINELTKNVDGYRLSTFFHKERDGKLKAGPMWDYNLAFGNANYCTGGDATGWVLNFNQFCPQDGWTINTYWDRLLSDPYFGQKLNDRWIELRESSFSDENILASLNDLVQRMDDAPTRNFSKWPILDTWIWPNTVVLRSYQAEVNFLRTWLRDRLAWMDANMPSISLTVRGPYSRPFLQISPNPYVNEVTIRLLREVSESLTFEVYDMQGRRLVNLALAAQAGYDQFFVWDGNTENGGKLSPGVYVYRILSGKELVDSGKLVNRTGL